MMQPRLPSAMSRRKPAPTLRSRLVSGVGGCLLGGVVGYGIVRSGPGPSPSPFEPAAFAWVFGLAGVCGLLAAISPRKAWRPSRKYGWSRAED